MSSGHAKGLLETVSVKEETEQTIGISKEFRTRYQSVAKYEPCPTMHSTNSCIAPWSCLKHITGGGLSVPPTKVPVQTFDLAVETPFTIPRINWTTTEPDQTLTKRQWHPRNQVEVFVKMKLFSVLF